MFLGRAWTRSHGAAHRGMSGTSSRISPSTPPASATWRAGSTIPVIPTSSAPPGPLDGRRPAFPGHRNCAIASLLVGGLRVSALRTDRKANQAISKINRGADQRTGRNGHSAKHWLASIGLPPESAADIHVGSKVDASIGGASGPAGAGSACRNKIRVWGLGPGSPPLSSGPTCAAVPQEQCNAKCRFFCTFDRRPG